LKLLIDINVILDVMLAREPWARQSAQLLAAVEDGRAEGFVAAHTITTIHYIVAREKGKHVAARAVTDILRIVGVVPIGKADFHQALVLGINDFEDAVQAAAALQIGADYLITRNTKDFKSGSIEVRTPGEALTMF
jgi:predicted nucleic acid-binding protein